MEGSRLHIPVDFTAESLHSGGHSGTTIFPMGQGVGATWNVSMAERVGAAIAREARASGVAHGLCPVINIPTDPRFGRTQESYGEVSRAITSDAIPRVPKPLRRLCGQDPFIVGTMSAAATRGIQGPPSNGGPNSYLVAPDEHIIAQAKHFFAYGHGGREGRSAFIDERTLMDVYGRPWFKAVNESGLRGAMASHNSVNYQPMHGSRLWLTQTLRERLGFGAGYIAADADDVQQLFVTHKVASSNEESAVLAVRAGMDQDLNSLHNTPFSTLGKSSAAMKSQTLDAAIDRAAGNVSQDVQI